MVYLIDFENVHEEGFGALGRLNEKDGVYCFFTRNVAKISMSALAGIRSGQLHFIEAENGKQSLDMVLVSYLGYLIGTKPQELYYDIVSNDNGYNKVAEFWNKQGNGLRVRIRKTNEQKQKTEIIKQQGTTTKDRSPQQNPVTAENMQTPATSAPDTATNPIQQVTDIVQDSALKEPVKQKQRNRQRMQRQRTPKTDSLKTEEIKQSQGQMDEQTENPVETVNESVPQVSTVQAVSTTLDDAALKSLENAGITGATVGFIQSQVEKYRQDKNMKQLVYRAVVKKYGQKIGTQIYNNTKKLLIK